MPEPRQPDLRVLAIDAGGTMTDTFIVDGRGSFAVGKAQTTPEDESAGFMESARDALAQWGSAPGDAFGRGDHFAIPPGRSARLDRHQIFHLSAA